MIGTNQIIDITNQEYIWHLYVRYLCCCGQYNELTSTLRNIRETYQALGPDHQNRDLFTLFLNRVDVPGMENLTFLDHFLMWCNNSHMVEQLTNMGAQTHYTYQNYRNVLHRTMYVNPFSEFINIPGFPVFDQLNLVRQPSIRAILQNGNRLGINITVRRHIGHYRNTLHALVHNADFENHHERQRALLQLPFDNPELRDYDVRNNPIVGV